MIEGDCGLLEFAFSVTEKFMPITRTLFHHRLMDMTAVAMFLGNRLREECRSGTVGLMALWHGSIPPSPFPSEGKFLKYVGSQLVWSDAAMTRTPSPLLMYPFPGAYETIGPGGPVSSVNRVCAAFFTPTGGVIDRISIGVTAQNGAPPTTFGIYQYDDGELIGVTNVPKLGDVTFASTSPVGGFTANISPSITIKPGWFWMVNGTNAGTSLTMCSYLVSAVGDESPITGNAATDVGLPILMGKYSGVSGVPADFDFTQISQGGNGFPICRLWKS